MKQSQLFSKTRKEAPKDEVSINARLLIQAGFIDKLSAGIYTFLPLGLRVIKKIENIIREEMNKVGGQEILMPALVPRELWEQTGRWETFDALFKLKGADEKEYALGATHEEVVSPLLKKFVLSHKDLPFYIYQFQTKFRNELRAKSGLMRGREFIMKDLYSFHTDEKDLDEYYDKQIQAYKNIFARCGLEKNTHLTYASGGAFSKYSHEFQTLTESGEDIIYVCSRCGVAVNKEIFGHRENGGEADTIEVCPECGGDKVEEKKAVEVGNIFKLKTKFSDPFGLQFTDENGEKKSVIMGCYGIGLGRLIGTVAEIYHDEKGLVWPEEMAPFQAHIVSLGAVPEVKKNADKIYSDLSDAGMEVLYDDRTDASAGEKFADADLIGIPCRIVVSEKTLAQGKVELKRRGADNAELVDIVNLSQKI